MVDHLDDIIKNSYNSLNKTAPENIWQNISNDMTSSELHDSLDTKIKESYLTQSSSAPNYIWQNIKRQLTIDSVWIKIKRKLDYISMWYKLRTAGLISVLALLFFWIYELSDNKKALPVAFLEKKFESKNSHNIEKDAVFMINNSFKGTKMSAHMMQANQNENIYTSHHIESIENIHRNEINPHLIEVQKNDISLLYGEFHVNNNIPPIIEIKPYIFIPFHDIIKNEELYHNSALFDIDSSMKLYSDLKNNPVKRRNSFLIGTIFNYHYTWINNNETKEAFFSNSLISDNADFCQNLGILFGYQINNKSSIRSELFPNSKINQSYNVYSEGLFIKKKIELKYSEASLSYLRNLFHYKLIANTNLTAGIGVYIAKLKNYSVKYNNIPIQSTDSYKNIDFGLKFSVGQTETFHNFSIGYGIDFNYGINNIFKGLTEFPAYFDVTKNLSTGLYIFAAYHF